MTATATATATAAAVPDAATVASASASHLSSVAVSAPRWSSEGSGVLLPFFQLAMRAVNRQYAFRIAVVLHVLFVAILALLYLGPGQRPSAEVLSFSLLTLGIVEGAMMLGWRLTQVPKSQSLEFLLTSPVQPRRVFIAEASVGVIRLALLSLCGLPLFALMAAVGVVEPIDLPVLVGLPFLWSLVAGFGVTVWAYESLRIRRYFEIIGIVGVLCYLAVGVLAGDKLLLWLQQLPRDLARLLLDLLAITYRYNPFMALSYWLSSPDPPERLFQRIGWVFAGSAAFAGICAWRASYRLLGHFHDRHYRPLSEVNDAGRSVIGERPLSWWAVRRVMEYSGQVNIWLAGGASLGYSAYILFKDSWPPWLGTSSFQLFEDWGGLGALATGMVVLAAVPAAFQYGLWDSSIQDRCRRLELLLLSELDAYDYWHAALAAAWRRGRGYVYVAAILWTAALLSDRATPLQVLASATAGVLLWSLYFTIGFRSFSTGMQANGLGSLLTMGVPMLVVLLHNRELVTLAGWLPPGAVYNPLAMPLSPWWVVGPILMGVATLWLARSGLRHCDRELRLWYDRNHGKKGLS